MYTDLVRVIQNYIESLESYEDFNADDLADLVWSVANGYIDTIKSELQISIEKIEWER